MKISGFTIIRNAVINDYPIVEAIRSILPVVDEMIVSIGQSEDNTEELIRSIDSDKIKIYHSTWDMSLRKREVKYWPLKQIKLFNLFLPIQSGHFISREMRWCMKSIMLSSGKPLKNIRTINLLKDYCSTTSIFMVLMIMLAIAVNGTIKK